MNHILEEEARESFYRLRRKSVVSELVSILRHENNALLSFENVRDLLGKKSETYKGLQVVEVAKIIGSEGRYQDFTRSFLPKTNHLRDRWVSISKANRQDIILPPIQLFKVGDAYFVRDGNHRVSVARAEKVEMIDAEVIELDTDIYVTPDMSQQAILNRVLDFERSRFFKLTRLPDYIDVSHIVVSSPGAYQIIYQHIMGHKYFMEQDNDRRSKDLHDPKKESISIEEEDSREAQNEIIYKLENEIDISFAEAAQSWYSNIFLPILQLIRSESLLKYFPERTSADLYIWLVRHWDDLKSQQGEGVSLEAALNDYQRRNLSCFAVFWRKIFPGKKS